MATLTIKKFPDALLAQLKEKAASARRSVTQEVLSRLEESMATAGAPLTGNVSYSEAEKQADSWAELAGKWNSNLTVQEEIDQLYQARTRGRKVDL